MFSLDKILQRLFISILFMAISVLAVRVFRTVIRNRLRYRFQKKIFADNFGKNRPLLLYFGTSQCILCKPQEQQIEEAREILQGEGRILTVRKLNALAEPQLTKSLNILTVPTTILVDSQDRIAAWNPGLTKARTLIDQYAAIV
jgi:hypothetical protein